MTILTDALAIIHSVIKPLGFEASVTFQRYKSSAGDGTEIYGSAIPLDVVLEFRQRSVRTAEGELSISSATITIVDLPALLAATPATTGGGKAGWVFTKDRVILPNGTKPPILNVGGFVDGGTGYLIPTEIYLG
jgi:hypothetical protein